jgi:CRISPR-associated protein Cas6
MLDLCFPAYGETLPTDHAYGLFAALSQAVPALHQPKARFQLGNISGQYIGDGRLRLQPKRSRVWLRIPVEDIPTFLPLAGRTLDVAGNPIRLGVPQVVALKPVPSLVARVVTIKGFSESGAFLDAVRRQLNALGIAGELGIPLAKGGKRPGEPRRQIIRIKDKRVIGFPLYVTGLTAEESITLQETGLGGRRHLTCGFFVPLKTRLP